MGWFSSKTVYYVSSSSCPAFDPDARFSHYEAVLLDWTANGEMDFSEQVKSYYNTSRMRQYNGWLDWCSRNKFTDVFGKISSTMYGDATFDNQVIGNAVKHLVPLQEGDDFQVIRSELNFFSQDFYIRHLATQQGKAKLFYETSNPDYELSFPDDETIVATFSNGETVSGKLPKYASNTRFLEITYSILRSYTTGQENPETGEIDEIVVFEFIYGYIAYQEGTGNEVLDGLIKENSSEATASFFPCIPLRRNTAWYTGDNAKLIGKALAHLSLTNETNDPEEAYKTFKDALVEGMSSGNIGDIDYITLQLGVAMNSKQNSDAAYMYTFFRNVYANYALKKGLPPSQVWTPKVLNRGGGYLEHYFKTIWGSFANSGYSDSFFSRFQISCPSSNLNLTYSWGGADYFEGNGQFKPGAKQGDYGTLAGSFQYSYTVQEPAKDDEGNTIVSCDEDGCHVVYKPVTYTIQYTLILFCHQISKNRWNFVCFLDLSEYNLIYAGKGVEYWAYDAIKAAKKTGTVTHDFSEDLSSIPGHGSSKMTFYYVEEENDLDSGFVVPLEKNSLKEIGYVNQLQVAYGSAYLIINCWESKKLKWYQHGIIGSIIGAIMVVVGVIITYVSCGTLSYLGYALIGAGTGLFMVSTLGQKLLSMFMKVCTTLLGDKVGEWAYKAITTIIKVVLIVYAGPIGGPIVAGTFTATTSYLNGDSIGSSLFKGVIAGVATYAAGQFAEAYGASINNWAIESGYGATVGTAINYGLMSSIGATASAITSDVSFGEALLTGVITGLAAGGFNYIKNEYFGGDVLGDYLNTSINPDLSPGEGVTFQEFITNSLIGEFKGLVSNPATYVNLMKLSMDQQRLHRLANLDNDYKEFNNNLAAAQDVLDSLSSSSNTSPAAEFVCRLQTNLGRQTVNDPESLRSLSPDSFLSFATASGIDIARLSSGSITLFVDNKLSMDGFSPAPLFYTQTDPSLGN